MVQRRSEKNTFVARGILYALFFMCTLSVLFILLTIPQQKFTKTSSSASIVTEFGFHVYNPTTDPTAAQLQQLHPQWMRIQLDVTHPIPAPVYTTNIKTLMIINNQVVEAGKWPPTTSTDINLWKAYIDGHYIPALKRFLASVPNISAVEIWNEEDLHSAYVPPNAFAYMLKVAAATTKTFNKNIQVVMGGLASGSTTYVSQVRAADASAFNQVDGVAIHPYGVSPGGWCTAGCSTNLVNGDLAGDVNNYHNASGKAIWITEFGVSTHDTVWQAEYLSRVFSTLQHTGLVPVAIWYAYSNSGASWGLVDNSGIIKPVGQTFSTFSKPYPPNTTIIPHILSITPTLSPTPTLPPTIPAGTTVFSVTVCPHGLGNCGDNVNPTSGSGNTNPLPLPRSVTLTVLDANNHVVATGQGAVSYTSSKNFQGSVGIPNLPSGQYLLRVYLDGFLPRQLPGIFTVSHGQTLMLPSVSLVAGDINHDSQLDIIDYSLLISCFSTKQTTASCTTPPSSTSSGSDINDDGIVDGTDYNLFLKELSVQGGAL